LFHSASNRQFQPLSFAGSFQSDVGGSYQLHWHI
jgi:hypothetical protein